MDLKNGNKVNMEQSGLISTGQSENVDAQAEQPVNALYDPERDDAGTQSAERTSMQSRKKLLEEGANSFAGFLYWTHVIGVIFLIVGFVAPGWLTIKTRQAVLEEYGTSLTSKLVFQDYSLWYITQCTFSDDVMICDSITYRLINGALRGTCGSCHKLRINEYETESFMVYSGAGLVFSYGVFVRAQVLYTLGILIAIGSFREFRSFRINIKKAIDVNMTTKTWVFLLMAESLCACFVSYPAFMFLLMNFNIENGVQTPVGSVLAVLGGIMVALVTFTILLQIICCRNNKNVYLCYSEMESEKPNPEDDECAI